MIYLTPYMSIRFRQFGVIWAIGHPQFSFGAQFGFLDLCSKKQKRPLKSPPHRNWDWFIWGFICFFLDGSQPKKDGDILGDKLEQCGKANVINHFGIVYYGVYHITTVWSFYHNFFLPGLSQSPTGWAMLGKGKNIGSGCWSIVIYIYIIWHYDVLQCG